MPERRQIEERVGALERRIEEQPAPDVESAGAVRATNDRPDSEEIEDRLAALETRIDELEAGLQAVRGYVGNVEHVNENVERRANAALAAVERLESAPKTPPPIATASTESDDSTPPSQADAPSADDSSQGGLLDRVRSLR